MSLYFKCTNLWYFSSDVKPLGISYTFATATSMIVIAEETNYELCALTLIDIAVARYKNGQCSTGNHRQWNSLTPTVDIKDIWCMRAMRIWSSNICLPDITWSCMFMRLLASTTKLITYFKALHTERCCGPWRREVSTLFVGVVFKLCKKIHC